MARCIRRHWERGAGLWGTARAAIYDGRGRGGSPGAGRRGGDGYWSLMCNYQVLLCHCCILESFVLKVNLPLLLNLIPNRRRYSGNRSAACRMAVLAGCAILLRRVSGLFQRCVPMKMAQYSL